MLPMNMWKGVDSICEPSLISPPQTVCYISTTLLEGNGCLYLKMCVSERERGRERIREREKERAKRDWNALPFTDLKTHSFWVRVKLQEEADSFDLLLLSSCFHSLPGVISLYWVTRFPRVTEGTCCSPPDSFTSWTERGNFPRCGLKTASCHSHLRLIKEWNQEREKARARVSVCASSESWKEEEEK